MKQRGFTLIELMILIAIIGILTSIVLPVLLTEPTQGSAPVPTKDEIKSGW